MLKIINDPVFGFISISDPLILQIINHPYYQRLRRISQMASANFVYPGATHSRLHHSLGAYHLMCLTLAELQLKNIKITETEAQGAKIAILLHDIGHGPFSHALEGQIAAGLHHEHISLQIMQALNKEFNGALKTAIAIFTNKHPKRFLHQIVSGQLDVDRMDYLSRDSFFSGVSEGVIGYDRIIKMLTVVNNQLVVEEKGLHSIEKFLIARRLMYAQVYLHKTVIASEAMLVQIIQRVKHLLQKGIMQGSGNLYNFLIEQNITTPLSKKLLASYCQLDDVDIVYQIKLWQNHTDKVLSILCTNWLNRELFKCKLSAKPVSKKIKLETSKQLAIKYGLSKGEGSWLVQQGDISNDMYKQHKENIIIKLKNGKLVDIWRLSQVLPTSPEQKQEKSYYFCYAQA
jgi:uncharacterized protein